jgi:hypothetical protein
MSKIDDIIKTDLNKFFEDANKRKRNKEEEEEEEKTNKKQKMEEEKNGHLIVTKLRMFQTPDRHSGYLKVFPNNKHQNRKDGFGCCSLSPMRLGPIIHNQPGVPNSLNLENFHQGSKCFTEEYDAKEKKPSALYYKNRDTFFKDTEPHRHKYKGLDKKNKNIPLFFVFIDANGKEHHLSYVESRQFYCNFYERLAVKTKDFQVLLDKLKDGQNLQICGYDGRDIKEQDIEKEYLNPNAPFGHELVLYTLLIFHLRKFDLKELPWRKHANPMFMKQIFNE